METSNFTGSHALCTSTVCPQTMMSKLQKLSWWLTWQEKGSHWHQRCKQTMFSDFYPEKHLIKCRFSVCWWHSRTKPLVQNVGSKEQAKNSSHVWKTRARSLGMSILCYAHHRCVPELLASGPLSLPAARYIHTHLYIYIEYVHDIYMVCM